MKLLFAIISSVLLANAAAASPLSAVMTYESVALTAEGVKKQTRFQERLIRDDNTVWSQRIVPKSAPQHHDDDHEEHEHNLNFALAGKWLVRDKNNQITFRFVRDEDKKIIEPRKNEYGTLGFDGEWETAYYLVNRTALKKMNRLKQTAPAGASWYEQQDAQYFTRILWDEKNEIPLSIESGKKDGTTNDKITIAIAPAPTHFPWQSLTGYQTIAYEDLLD